jgi:hypothetical protein
MDGSEHIFLYLGRGNNSEKGSDRHRRRHVSLDALQLKIGYQGQVPTATDGNNDMMTRGITQFRSPCKYLNRGPRWTSLKTVI